MCLFTSLMTQGGQETPCNILRAHNLAQSCLTDVSISVSRRIETFLDAHMHSSLAFFSITMDLYESFCVSYDPRGSEYPHTISRGHPIWAEVPWYMSWSVFQEQIKTLLYAILHSFLAFIFNNNGLAWVFVFERGSRYAQTITWGRLIGPRCSKKDCDHWWRRTELQCFMTFGLYFPYSWPLNSLNRMPWTLKYNIFEIKTLFFEFKNG